MNRSVKAIQSRRDIAGFHLTKIIVPIAHTGNSAAQRYSKVATFITSKNASNRAKSQRYMQSEEFSNLAN